MTQMNSNAGKLNVLAPEFANQLKESALGEARITSNLYPDLTEMGITPLERLWRLSIWALKGIALDCHLSWATKWQDWWEAMVVPFDNDKRTAAEKLVAYVAERKLGFIQETPEIRRFEQDFDFEYRSRLKCWAVIDEESDTRLPADIAFDEAKEFRQQNKFYSPDPNEKGIDVLERLLRLAILALKPAPSQVVADIPALWARWYDGFNKPLPVDQRSTADRFAAYIRERKSGAIHNATAYLEFELGLEAHYKSALVNLEANPHITVVSDAEKAAVDAKKIANSLVCATKDKYPFVNEPEITPLERLYRLSVLAVKPGASLEILGWVERWRLWYDGNNSPLEHELRVPAKRLLVYTTDRRTKVIKDSEEVHAFESAFDDEYRQSQEYLRWNSAGPDLGPEQQALWFKISADHNRKTHQNYSPNVNEPDISPLQRLYRLAVLALKPDATPFQLEWANKWSTSFDTQYSKFPQDTRNITDIFLEYTTQRINGIIKDTQILQLLEFELDMQYRQSEEYLRAQNANSEQTSLARHLKEVAEKRKEDFARECPNVDQENITPRERLYRLSICAIRDNASERHLEWAEIWRRWWRRTNLPIPHDTRTAAEELLEYTIKRRQSIIDETPEIKSFELKFDEEYLAGST